MAHITVMESDSTHDTPQYPAEAGDGAVSPRLSGRRRTLALAAAGLPVLGAAMLAIWATNSGGGAAGDGPAGPIADDPAIAAAGLPAAADTVALAIKEVASDDALTINEARPFDAKPEMPRAFRFGAGVEDRARAADCLAAAAWYEAGNDRAGQKAVAQVVLNRVRHPAYPPSVCGVVFEGSERRTGCQFTFTCDGAMRRRPSDRQWQAAHAIAEKAIGGDIDKDVGTATHYHADYVIPVWSDKLQKIAQVGPHIFYRWPGGFGSRRVFRDPGSQMEPRIAQLSWVNPDYNKDKAPEAEPQSDDKPVSFAEMTAALPAAVGTARRAQALRADGSATARIVMRLDMGQPAGRWAMNALKNCDGQQDCQVLGYAQDVPASGRPAFLYVRDGASGLDQALWDCERFQRPSASQCLPADGPALSRLMRDRSTDAD
ncbi:cell wall hydrolase [Croceicoccus mobilis]|nr:cell wall hydrolase [Croceicoccus mobilis]